MKVKDVIDRLKELPEDFEVCLLSDKTYNLFAQPIGRISVYKIFKDGEVCRTNSNYDSSVVCLLGESSCIF